MKFTNFIFCIVFLNLSALGLYAQYSCPKISLQGPSMLMKVGEPMVFTAQVEGIDGKFIKSYNWTVDKGEITQGQGTPVITVDTEGLQGFEEVRVTLTVNLDGFENCGKVANMVSVIQPKIEAKLFERMKNPLCEYRQMIMDGYFAELNNDPSAKGYIFTFGSPRRVAKVEKLMRANIKWRNFPADRIVFVNGGGRSKKPTIELWIAPDGADTPTPEPPVEDEADFDTEIDTTEIVIDPKEPYIFSSEYYDSGSCIGEVQELDLEGYAKMLKANPKSRGNIVILLMSKAEFRKKEKEILNYLTKKGIARKRLKTFLVNTFGGVELWILP